MSKQVRRKSIPLAPATIEEVLEKFMVQHETRDLHKLLLKPLQDLSWSSAPATHMAKMLELADLWEGFIGNAPNGVLPPSATKKGIDACNAQGLINFTGMTSSIFADQVGVVGFALNVNSAVANPPNLLHKNCVHTLVLCFGIVHNGSASH